MKFLDKQVSEKSLGFPWCWVLGSTGKQDFKRETVDNATSCEDTSIFIITNIT